MILMVFSGEFCPRFGLKRPFKEYMIYVFFPGFLSKSKLAGAKFMFFFKPLLGIRGFKQPDMLLQSCFGEFCKWFCIFWTICL